MTSPTPLITVPPPLSMMSISRSVAPCEQHASGLLHAVFVDFKRAYDLVNREALWLDLQNRVGVPAALLNVMRGLYEEDAYVLVDGAKRTDPVHPTHGVKQGCPLSPMLFSLFISDVSPRLDRAAGSDLVPGAAGPGEGALSHLLFADDLTLVSRSEACMARLLDELDAYCRDKGMRVNVLKTKAVRFAAGAPRAVPPVSTFAGEAIESVEEFMYLGLLFRSRLSFTRMAQRWEGPLRGGCAKAFSLAREQGVPHAVLVLLQTFGFSCMMYMAVVGGVVSGGPVSLGPRGGGRACVSDVWGPRNSRIMHLFPSRHASEETVVC